MADRVGGWPSFFVADGVSCPSPPHFFVIFPLSFGVSPRRNHSDTIIRKIPGICKMPMGSFQKIGPATEGMIIPYITQIAVTDIVPTLIAVIETVCRLNTIIA